MRNATSWLLSGVLSVGAAIAAVVAFITIEAAAVRVPPGNNGAGYVGDPLVGFDIAARTLPDTAEIVALGCSQTYGWGVQPGETFAAIAAGSSSFINLAVPSYGGASSLAMLERHASLRPRVIIYGLWAEHRIRNVSPCVETPTPLCIQRPTIERVGATYQLEPPRDIVGMQMTRRWVLLAGGSYLDRMRASAMALGDRLTRPAVSKADPVDAEVFVLRRMAATARAMGARLIVVYLPDYLRGWPPAPDYRALAQQEGFLFLDATPELREVERRGANVGIPGDGHLSAEAHRVVANVISRAVSAK